MESGLNHGLSALRIGHGFDVHAFAAGRELILANIPIPHTQGLLGHSDADVVLHALTDAILGSAAAGDIGAWFPDTDPQFKNADSGQLLRIVWNDLTAKGWKLINCDIVVMAERPKLLPYVAQMRERIAEILAVTVEQVGLKATTTERLGFVGRQEGIAASAVCLLTAPRHVVQN